MSDPDRGADRNLAIAQIRAMLPLLGPSERRVAEVILDRPGEVTEWRATQVGAEAGASAATVVRACKRLGYSGWTQLQEVLSRAGSSSAAGDTDGAAAVRRILQAGVQQLEDSIARLDAATIDAVLDLLDGPGRLLFAATGSLAPIAQYAAGRFAGIGRSAEASTDALVLHLTARGLGPGDVCMALADTGANSLTVRAAAAAVEAGATVVSITNAEGSPLGRQAAHQIVLGVPDPRPIADQLARVKVGHMLILDALFSALELRRGTAASRTTIYETIAQYAYPRYRPSNGSADF